jgi:uncharacterized membrane protein
MFSFFGQSSIMWDFLSQTTTQAVLSVVAAGIVIAMGWQLVLKLRDSSKDDLSEDLNTLTNFKEMRLEGDISDAEFRSIKQAIRHDDDQDEKSDD